LKYRRKVINKNLVLDSQFVNYFYKKKFEGKINNIFLINYTERYFSDGGVSEDLPMKRISSLFNVNNFIIS